MANDRARRFLWHCEFPFHLLLSIAIPTPITPKSPSSTSYNSCSGGPEVHPASTFELCHTDSSMHRSQGRSACLSRASTHSVTVWNCPPIPETIAPCRCLLLSRRNMSFLLFCQPAASARRTGLDFHTQLFASWQKQSVLGYRSGLQGSIPWSSHRA